MYLLSYRLHVYIRDPTHALIWRYLIAASYVFDAKQAAAGRLHQTFFTNLFQHLVRKIRTYIIPTLPIRANPNSFPDLMFEIRNALFHGDAPTLQFADSHLHFRAVRDGSIENIAEFATWFFREKKHANRFDTLSLFYHSAPHP